MRKLTVYPSYTEQLLVMKLRLLVKKLKNR